MKRSTLIDLTYKMAQRMGVRVDQVFVRNLKGSWGIARSTFDKKTGTMTYFVVIHAKNLLKLPDDCYDFVVCHVVHELAHYFVKGHGKRFWAIVSRFVPDLNVRHKVKVTVDSKSFIIQSGNDVKYVEI